MSDHSTNVANRSFLPLEGGVNFRDVGGYHAADGRLVRRGRVFRTGVLCYLTEADGVQLKPLGVRRIFDLRRASERTREPTCWPDTTVVSHTWDDGAEPPNVMRIAKAKTDSVSGMRDAMIELYQALPNWMAPRIREFLKVLREEQTPVVIHCAAGKDRTGVAVAVLLHSLGVRHEDVLHDYLLTNEVGNLEQFWQSRRTVELGVATAERPLTSMDIELRRALLRADADYLDAAFRQIDREYGNIDGYLEQALHVTPEAREQLRKSMLVSA
jgi:protein-tyrosine phosphatase